MTIQTAQLQVNPTRLISGLQFAFTHHTSVISELIQNGRRAGATQVSISFDPTGVLTVTDNGDGIQDFQNLLSVASSGWDAETIQTEHPFGIGFLSALYACEDIEVVSRGQRLKARTQDILAFKPVAISSVDPAIVGTEVTLRGLKHLSALATEAMAKRVARGFPIDVLFNGVRLNRRDALDQGKAFMPVERVGFVHIPGFGQSGTEPEWVKQIVYLSHSNIYLLGAPVVERFLYDGDQIVVHLDPLLYRARLPDRDKLIDEGDAIRKIKDAITRKVRDLCLQNKETMPMERFVEGLPFMKSFGCQDLLNDVPVLPANVLSQADRAPFLSYSNTDHLRSVANLLTQEECAGKTILRLQRLDSEGGIQAHLFAWASGALILNEYDDDLDPGHWIHSLAKELPEPTLEILDETHRATYEGRWVYQQITCFCRRYRLSYEGVGSEEFADRALYWTNGDDETLFVVPQGDVTGLVVTQKESFYDENDNYCEDAEDREVNLFRVFTLSQILQEPIEALAVLLPRAVGDCPVVQGRAFRVEIDTTGGLTVAGLIE